MNVNQFNLATGHLETVALNIPTVEKANALADSFAQCDKSADHVYYASELTTLPSK